MKPWYEQYFDAEYYREYSDHKSAAQNDKETRFIAQVLKCKPGSRLLDLGCGFGRLSIPLSKLGFRIVGLDLSPALLAKLYDSSIASSLNVTIHCEDMRKMTYDREFDAVIMMFSSFGYSSDEDDLVVLEGIDRALNPGGLLLIDLDNPIKLFRRFQREDWRLHEDGGVILNKRLYNPITGKVEGQRIYMKDGEPSREYAYCIRLYTHTEIVRILNARGFTLLHSYGSYDADLYDMDSDRMIILAQKALSTV